ncbi:MAG TPA: transcription elongation factor GreA, partial [Anaerolineales bacterium]|nr:transcription elongation factor GreA [Anaerolineales bacterium]
MAEPTYLTPEGEAKLKAELEELKGPRREELAQRLRAAIQMGDLSENADYHKAKEDQGFLEGRIQEIEFILRSAVIIEENTNKDVVSVGSH